MSADRDQEDLPDSRREEWQRARRPGEKAARREAILSAARSLLDDEGVEGTTLSEIGRESGVSKASCYRNFEKEGLGIPFPQMDVHLHQTGTAD